MAAKIIIFPLSSNRAELPIRADQVQEFING